MKRLMLALFLAATFQLIGSLLTPSLAQKTARVPAAAKQELMKAANAHSVKIDTDKIVYVSNQQMTIVHAPIQGRDKYKDADFEKGAPMVLVNIKSSEKYVVPNGSYVVKLQLLPNAAAGRALFADPAGNVIGQQELDKPLFPLSDFRDPCNVENYPRLVRTIPGPIPGPGGGYGIDFPCFACACSHYRYFRTPRKAEDKVATVVRELDALKLGNALGVACMASSDFVCPALPVPRP